MEQPAGDNAHFDLSDALGPADEQLVRIQTSRIAHANGEALVVTVAGEIDMYTVDRLRTAVAAGFDQLHDAQILVIDLTKVTFLSSEGLQALVEVTQTARRRREPLPIVVDQTRPVIRPIEITGLDAVLALFDTVEDALQAPSW
jgi:anti-sigma B factor antagonist